MHRITAMVQTPCPPPHPPVHTFVSAVPLSQLTSQDETPLITKVHIYSDFLSFP